VFLEYVWEFGSTGVVLNWNVHINIIADTTLEYSVLHLQSKHLET